MKKAWLEKAILDFKNSSQGVAEYMELFYVFHKCMKPGDGLIWAEVESILDKAINDVR